MQASSEGEISGVGRTRPAEKSKGKGNGGKGEHESKGKGGFGSKGMQLEERTELKSDEEDERVQVAPNMGAHTPRPCQTQ